MNMGLELTADWINWISLNLSRNCTPASMVEMMLESGFDAAYAYAAVNSAIAGEGMPYRGALDMLRGQTYEPPVSRLPPGNMIDTSDQRIHVVLRRNRPYVAVLHNMLCAEECDEIIALSAGRLQRSGYMDSTTGDVTRDHSRTSEETFFELGECAVIARIERRIAELMSCPVSHGEEMHVMRYSLGEEYAPHYDYFPWEYPGSHVHLREGGQRFATLIMYLNDVEEGGATRFPKIGLDVVPRKGSALYFEYLNEQGHVDKLTYHAGAPVLRGEKWIATKWLRQRASRSTSEQRGMIG
jgi:prolyl 4-hydroxylase